MIGNYFSAGGLIQERLQDDLGDLLNVYVVATIPAALQLMQRAPCVFVIPDLDAVSPAESSVYGDLGFADQRWLICVAVRNVEEALLGRAALEEAGETVTRILRLLSGWKPSREHAPLIRTGAPRLNYDAGQGFIPLAFATQIHIEGTVNAYPID